MPRSLYWYRHTQFYLCCRLLNHHRVSLCGIIANHGSHGLLNRYVILRGAHAPGMPGTFSPPLRVSDPDMHHGTCVTHVPWCMPGSLTSGFLWSRWRGKRSRHSRRLHNQQFYVFGKRPMTSQYSPSWYEVPAWLLQDCHWTMKRGV